MRVITGNLRGRKLKTLEGEETRPTSDRIKETMFSIIQFDVPFTNVLDLFAGSGQLGIEALSRGAKFCTFVERSKDAVAIVRDNLNACRLTQSSRVLTTDSFSYLKSAAAGHQKFDIILIDPPYYNGFAEKALMLCEPVMSESCIIVCEHEAELVLPKEIGGLALRKRYGCGRKTALSVFVKAQTEV